jgi:hypothetical protein
MPLSAIAEADAWLRYWDNEERRHYLYNPATEETAWQGSFEGGDPPFVDGDDESAAAAAAAAAAAGALAMLRLADAAANVSKRSLILRCLCRRLRGHRRRCCPAAYQATANRVKNHSRPPSCAPADSDCRALGRG